MKVQNPIQKILNRYTIITLLMVVIGLAVFIKATWIVFKQNDYWKAVASRFVRENVEIEPNRGNIFSADGKLMASSLPEYRIYMDFMVCKQNNKDSLLMAHLDEIAQAMHKILPDKSAAYFKRIIRQGRNKNSRHHRLYPKPISYIQYKELKKLPIFKLGKYTGGFHEEMYSNQRKHPFGSLAQRTLGDVYLDYKKIAKNGIERAYDDYLRGKPGRIHRQRIQNKYIAMVDIPAEDGCDIITTLDVDMQDICEKALVDKLYEVNAMSGSVVLMDVKTGDIKAIVNMTRASDGRFYEMKNNAISDMYEPGSIFKTVSFLIALEDGYIKLDDTVETKDGYHIMHGAAMIDHNRNRGGYGTITLRDAFKYSSNIGVSRPIDEAYHDKKQKFYDGIKRIGLDQPLKLQIEGEGTPYIKNPEKGEFQGTTLPWMSIGYETQIPPLNMLNFYNAIANNGKMLRPRLVTAVVKNGSIIEEFKPEVMNSSIASNKTLKQIQELLKLVVVEGTGKPAKSDQFDIAGKTGTAIIPKRNKGYATGNDRDYNMNFCGYFPADEPKYSCIVSIQRSGFGSYAASMCGPVFKKIAERVYAKDLKMNINEAIDSTSLITPKVKKGEMMETLYVLNELNIKTTKDFIPNKNKSIWGTAEEADNLTSLKSKEIQNGIVPNIKGMGAKDAVFLLEQLGLRVNLSGVGHVTYQSIAEGTKAQRGQTISLRLN